jgi:hypothetical protein
MPATMPKPLSVSDTQLLFVTNLVEPLRPRDRSRFLEELAAALRHELMPLGDGVLHRRARETFARHFKPPKIDRPAPLSPRQLKRQQLAEPIAD